MTYYILLVWTLSLPPALATPVLYKSQKECQHAESFFLLTNRLSKYRCISIKTGTKP